MMQKQDNENMSFDEMILSGNLIPTTGPLGEESKNPLKDLSCAEVLAHMADFCDGKLGNELVLRKMEKHLKENVSGKRDCGCSKIFLETKQKKESGI